MCELTKQGACLVARDNMHVSLKKICSILYGHFPQFDRQAPQ